MSDINTHHHLTNQIRDDTITTKIIPTIDKDGNRSDVPHQIKKSKDKTFETFGKYGNLGFYIAIPIVLGTFVGISLDNIYSTKPVFTLAGLGFGFVSGIYNLIRTLKQ